MRNKYLDRYVARIRAAETEEDIAEIINKVYEDGFEDGTNAKD